MTKTKRQLRAEAVENLKANSDWAWHDLADFFKASGLMDSPYNTPYRELRAALIDLLEDDELPEGDAVAIMRKVANCGEVTGNAMRKEVGGTDWADALLILADMVERDYVRRDGYDFTVEMLNCMKAERDEWKAKAEQAQESYIDAKQDRDAWKAKYLGAMNDAEDYKTLWQRSRERSTKSSKRAATVERLRRYQDEELTNKGYTAKVEYPLDELIDLLTDDDANDDSAPKNNVSANAVDANDGLMDLDSCTHGMRTFASETDSREKLEESAWQYDASYAEPYEHGAIAEAIIELLDRQAAITERHWMEIVGASANCNLELTNQIAELQSKADEQRKSLEAAWEDNAELTEQLEAAHAKNRALKAHISKMQEGRHGWHVKGEKLQKQVDALTQANGDLREEWHRVCAERDKLNRELHESNREREQLRKQLGIAIDHAHDMIALVSVDTDEGLA